MNIESWIFATLKTGKKQVFLFFFGVSDVVCSLSVPDAVPFFG